MTDKTLKDDKHSEPDDAAVECLKDVDEWSFDVFTFADKTEDQPLKYLAQSLFDRYGIFQKFSIDRKVFDNFITRIEAGYKRFSNPYHNNVHAADVTQTLHSIFCKTRLNKWLTDLEIFACLLAALIHDYEHTGTTNGFHVMTRSDRALIYNDRSVQENHHLSASFRILREDECNILAKLSRDEYRQFRGFVIDLVLSTDIAFHFQIQKDIQSRINSTELKIDKSKALALVLHACDVSSPTKNWNLHYRWSTLIMTEFFKQGDRERELELPISPLCDKYETFIPESQINFIEFIVIPVFTVCGEMIELIVKSLIDKNNDEKNKSCDITKTWMEGITENKKKWQEISMEDRCLPSQKKRTAF
ncbi:dual specificity calcium/calmodulin-dependent 3',5'-cyclic nucleotide phosphodiesterase 1-like [Eupeodes corollae]|uniref:dual specificity calcium/calmodulin-dependent 3',5'-cyclic nucleotide phosphodiesterase 1-like n=1 Tax=Eupeodes corollae TaxID=290404 RepID=UPI002493450C|nr:dual specificity calcium/calmodulin-dependent 3',5'-cyclic nucleotide phosphodiesterase 1-like [Eupeodes corollae]